MTSAYQQRNNQAVKVILSELYVTWATEYPGFPRIKESIQEILAAAKSTRSKAAARDDKLYNSVGDLSAPTTSFGADTLNKDDTKGGSGHVKSTVSKSNPLRGGTVNPSVPTTRYNERSTATSSSTHGTATKEPPRSISPPATPPSRIARRRTDDYVTRTPSPVQPTVVPSGAAGRFLGVDELDYPLRGGSPGHSPGQSKPVVDPMAPLPHGASTSPGSVYSASLPIADNINTVMVSGDLLSSMDSQLNSSSREPQTARFVHSSGSFASLPPANVKQASLVDIPVFYSRKEANGVAEQLPYGEVSRLKSLSSDAEKTIRKGQLGDICVSVFGVPMWLNELLYETITAYCKISPANSLTLAHVSRFYYEIFGKLTPNRRLFELIRTDPHVEHLTIDDLKSMVKCLVSSHPSLEFLQQPEFQEYYCRTVAIRIMYSLERQHTRKVQWRDFDRSDLPEVMMELDSKDVNQVLEYFSYEHFYVLYCKFWELDTDRDLLVGFDDLSNYGQGSVVPAVIKRIVEGHGRPLTSGEPGKLDFEDFVYFCLSEENKNSEAAVYYWFRVLDTDGDGILSGYELYEFFRENHQRFLEYSDSPEGDIRYEDMMCQMLDMLGYDRIKDHKFGVTLGDLRACPTSANFLNMIFNAPKFMMFEHRDPFMEHQQKLRPEKTEWDRFARDEYDRMAAEAQ